MSIDSVTTYVSKHKWWVAAVVIVAAGYTFGKDIALRDNARESAQLSAETQ